MSREAARGLPVAGATESSLLKLLPRPSLKSRLTSLLPLATLRSWSLKSTEPECEWPMLE